MYVHGYSYKIIDSRNNQLKINNYKKKNEENYSTDMTV